MKPKRPKKHRSVRPPDDVRNAVFIRVHPADRDKVRADILRLLISEQDADE